ncbi:trypsin-like peptidase domain-containing protein [Paenibacillus polygoni]|uniref:Trypsin-like peptidase domain-containing protein n=1 Tax=Paenibacillus polygoni TaxID=3050112 RepID=A0ABY8X464_9BACL|nr:trypsin-like peptidase domain-containing protein [Paenibacillus polygoni]WIV18759.1 trypsin-like peptidase domain-containing protein [Paenibacillus polygoni]
MSKGLWISTLTCLTILGLGGGGMYFIHTSAANELNGQPLLALQTSAETTAMTAEGKTKKTRKEIIEDSQKRVVTIKSGNSLGSGFLYNKQGDILTNAHVVDGSKQVTVRTLSQEEYEGTVIGISTDTDIAVVRVPDLEKLSPLSLAEEGRAEVGDEILALGSPLGFENTVTTGIVSGLDRSFDIAPYTYSNLYQISAPITHGNSGGPLISSDTGKVLGINSAIADEDSTIGFSIPIPSILQQAREWSKTPMTELPNLPNDDDIDSDSNVQTGDERDIVTYFYQSLNDGDYVTAYYLLGSDWQSGISYEDFRAGYLHTGYIDIGSVTLKEQADEAMVEIEITAEEWRDSGTVYQNYRMSYTVGYENGDLKILHGKGKKI